MTETQTIVAPAAEHVPEVLPPTPASPSKPSQVVEGLAHQAYERAAPYFSPVVKTAKKQLPTELVQRLEAAATSASIYSHQLLEQVDTASDAVQKRLHEAGEGLASVRKSPEVIAAKVTEGSEFVKTKVIPAVPKSFAEVKTLGLESYEQLKTALQKLKESLPTLADVQAKLPEEQLEKIKHAITGVLERLPKLPTIELPKVDLSKYNSQEIVKFGHSILERVLPYIQPYQSRIEKLLTDYQVADRAVALQKSAQGYYRQYNVEKYAPKFVTGLVLGEEKAEKVPAVAAAAEAPAVPAQ